MDGRQTRLRILGGTRPDPFRDRRGTIQTHGSALQMRRGPFFAILALLSLLASVAMALDNNWLGAAFGCVVAVWLFAMAIL
jgi:hypothetical protein